VKATDVPRPRDGVLFRELEDGCVLYDPDGEKVHSLNETAGFVWCLMDGARSLGEIAGEIARAAGADEAVVLRDVIRTADRFARQGLLE
jgi:hypothetical protein